MLFQSVSMLTLAEELIHEELGLKQICSFVSWAQEHKCFSVGGCSLEMHYSSCTSTIEHHSHTILLRQPDLTPTSVKCFASFINRRVEVQQLLRAAQRGVNRDGESRRRRPSWVQLDFSTRSSSLFGTSLWWFCVYLSVCLWWFYNSEVKDCCVCVVALHPFLLLCVSLCPCCVSLRVFCVSLRSSCVSLPTHVQINHVSRSLSDRSRRMQRAGRAVPL